MTLLKVWKQQCLELIIITALLVCGLHEIHTGQKFANILDQWTKSPCVLVNLCQVLVPNLLISWLDPKAFCKLSVCHHAYWNVRWLMTVLIICQVQIALNQTLHLPSCILKCQKAYNCIYNLPGTNCFKSWPR